MSILDPTPEDIIKFWFEEAGAKRWYSVSPAFDARVRRRFARALDRHARIFCEDHHPWLSEPDGAFALILMFDQFSRNIYRGSGRAFAYDALARHAALEMIECGFDWVIPAERRDFVYMPFMHAESLEHQDLCIALASSRLEQDSTLHHAIKHREVIARFGRFPFRNEALGRASTPGETAYLDGGGYAPGRKKA